MLDLHNALDGYPDLPARLRGSLRHLGSRLDVTSEANGLALIEAWVARYARDLQQPGPADAAASMIYATYSSEWLATGLSRLPLDGVSVVAPNAPVPAPVFRGTIRADLRGILHEMYAPSPLEHAAPGDGPEFFFSLLARRPDLLHPTLVHDALAAWAVQYPRELERSAARVRVRLGPAWTPVQQVLLTHPSRDVRLLALSSLVRSGRARRPRPYHPPGPRY